MLCPIDILGSNFHLYHWLFGNNPLIYVHILRNASDNLVDTTPTLETKRLQKCDCIHTTSVRRFPFMQHNLFLQQVSFWPDEDLYSSPRSPNVEDDRLSIASQLRKTKSMDASCLDMRSINDATSPMKPLSRAKSDFNLTASTHSLVQGECFVSFRQDTHYEQSSEWGC
jgi:hypothetical protein